MMETVLIAAPRHRQAAVELAPGLARLILLGAVLVALAAGFLAAGPAARAMAAQQAGGDLTRLLRAMAALKALMAAGVTAAILWRLAAAISPARLAAYALACAAMAAGPGMIWGMADVGTGALLLHGGLLAAILLLWRDPATAARLAAVIETRRRAANYRISNTL